MYERRHLLGKPWIRERERLGRGMWRMACGAYYVSMVGWWALLERVAFGG